MVPESVALSELSYGGVKVFIHLRRRSRDVKPATSVFSTARSKAEWEVRYVVL
jgi:hypothetical protein